MAETTPTATMLADRALIRLSGEDVRGFLDGLVTNKLDRLPAYAALLTPQGKVLADFIIWDDSDDLLLDAVEADAEALMRRLGMYRLRRALTIEREEKLAVHWDEAGADDPRLPALGRRWIAPRTEPASGWLEHRLRQGVCEGSAELGDLLWLECNADDLHGVSFSKGCFVGQENTARMNWRSKVNRRLFVVEGDGGTRVRVAYPELGLTVVHARVDDIPDGAIIPDWMNLSA
ncbi:MAG: folate-binding protein [Sphingomicrobium sp.]